MNTMTKTLPALDRPDEDQISDEMLLAAALTDRKALRRVKGSTRSSLQSHDARAWTQSGNVD